MTEKARKKLLLAIAIPLLLFIIWQNTLRKKPGSVKSKSFAGLNNQAAKNELNKLNLRLQQQGDLMLELEAERKYFEELAKQVLHCNKNTFADHFHQLYQRLLQRAVTNGLKLNFSGYAPNLRLLEGSERLYRYSFSLGLKGEEEGMRKLQNFLKGLRQEFPLHIVGLKINKEAGNTLQVRLELQGLMLAPELTDESEAR